MSLVTLQCRDCETTTDPFASVFDPDEDTKIEDMQQHMDTQFVARCGKCFACNWEVTEVSNGARNKLHAV